MEKFRTAAMIIFAFAIFIVPAWLLVTSSQNQVRENPAAHGIIESITGRGGDRCSIAVKIDGGITEEFYRAGCIGLHEGQKVVISDNGILVPE